MAQQLLDELRNHHVATLLLDEGGATSEQGHGHEHGILMDAHRVAGRGRKGQGPVRKPKAWVGIS